MGRVFRCKIFLPKMDIESGSCTFLQHAGGVVFFATLVFLALIPQNLCHWLLLYNSGGVVIFCNKGVHGYVFAALVLFVVLRNTDVINLFIKHRCSWSFSSSFGVIG